MRSQIRTLLCSVALVVTTHPSLAGDQWSHYGGSAAGSRFVANSTIDQQNVRDLDLAWQFRTGDSATADQYRGNTSSFKATPILIEKKLVFSTGFNRVFALDPGTGNALWSFDPRVDFGESYSETFTSRGVSAWSNEQLDPGFACRTRIFLGTLDARLIAIDADDGQLCRDFGSDGTVDLSVGIRNYRFGQYSLTSPVTVVNDIVVVGSSVGDNGAVDLESGVVRGFDARTGNLAWRWDPLAASTEESRTGAANVWSVMSADEARGVVYLPTTSPSPDFYGGHRPGDNADANSLVALDAKSGRRLWSFQVVHHDLWDYDLASQPALTDINDDGSVTPVVVVPTKIGHVFVLNRETGQPYFPVEERPVPQSDVAGEQTSPTQPFPVKPPPLHDATVQVWNFSEEHKTYCESLLEGVRYEGPFTPPSEQGTLLFPGNGGGTNWGSLAVDEQRQLAILAVNRLPTIVKLIPRADFVRRRRQEAGGPLGVQFTSQRGAPFGMARHEVYNPELMIPCLEGPWGELFAIDLVSGNVRWRVPFDVFPQLADHPQASRWGSLAAGGPMATSTGLVFMASPYGRRLLAIRTQDGQTVWTRDLPASPAATPMSYNHEGRQYVVIAAGGAMPESDEPGDFLLAFALPDN